MKLNRKILFVTISVLFISLLVSSAINIINFRKNYTEALITGSYGLGQSLNSVISEMLDLGLPLESLAGMDKKLKQLVKNNPHISYVGIGNLTGQIFFHSDTALVGKIISDEVMKKSSVATQPLTQTYHRFDGYEYYDVTLPIFDSSKTHVGITRLGFRTEVVNDKVRDAIIHVAVNFALTFLLIAFLINLLLSRLVSQPVIALADQARKIAEGHYDAVIPVVRNDEIGLLSASLGAMATTIQTQMESLQESRDDLEHQVAARTAELSASLDQVRSQQVALRESETHLRTIIENEPQCIKIIDARGCLTQMNPAGLAMIEADSLEQVAGQSVLSIVAPEYRQAFTDMHQRVLAGESVQMEFEILGLKGGHRWLETHAVPLQENGGTVLLGVTRDISARKIAEAELLRSNSELEQFSYSISHDMRQPLRMISSYLQLLQASLADQLNGEKREYFNFAIDGAKRMDAMMLGLLDYSRVGRKGEPPAWVESRKILDEALLFLQPAIAEAQADIRIQGDWPRIHVSPDEMLRLVQNLIGNALKFRVAGRKPELTVTGNTTGKEWRLSVTDNGVGILPDQIGRLFKVFQRLQSRAAYEGTGIGLALCRRIVEHHGGTIRAESAGEDMGCSFIFTLPVSTGSGPRE